MVVGFIALAGVAAETGVIMRVYLDQALEQRRALAKHEGRSITLDDIHAAIIDGAVERVRPKMMTVSAIMRVFSLFSGAMAQGWKSCSGSPYLWWGGMVSAAVLTLVVIPAIYAVIKAHLELRRTMNMPALISQGHECRERKLRGHPLRGRRLDDRSMYFHCRNLGRALLVVSS